MWLQCGDTLINLAKLNKIYVSVSAKTEETNVRLFCLRGEYLGGALIQLTPNMQHTDAQEELHKLHVQLSRRPKAL